jgi:hypothetical protein
MTIVLETMSQVTPLFSLDHEMGNPPYAVGNADSILW